MTAGVVVVGGGFAALEIALALRKQRRHIPVTVVSTETEITYRPWLIKVAAGGVRPPVIPFARLLATAGVDLVSDAAVSVDLDARRIGLGSGRTLDYGQLVAATGAGPDRGRLPGAREHALFPCGLSDAAEFAARVSAGARRVAVVFGWERPGPGLEYAAWIAARRPGVTVIAMDGDGTLDARFGDQATSRLRAIFERRGGQLISARPVTRIGEGSVELDGGAVAADVVALAAPLRGASAWLPQALLDERGMLRVDSAMAAATGLFGIGDLVTVPDGYRLRPALMSITATAGPIAANVVRAMDGAALKPVLRLNQPDMMAPDLAGDAVLVRNRRLVMSGRLPLLFRSIIDRRYLRLRRAHAVPAGPSPSGRRDPVS